jgi:hypothetical protein
MVLGTSTRWFKYDRDYLCVNKSQFVPVIFEPPCILKCGLYNVVTFCSWHVGFSVMNEDTGTWKCVLGFASELPWTGVGTGGPRDAVSATPDRLGEGRGFLMMVIVLILQTVIHHQLHLLHPLQHSDPHMNRRMMLKLLFVTILHL